MTKPDREAILHRRAHFVARALAAAGIAAVTAQGCGGDSTTDGSGGSAGNAGAAGSGGSAGNADSGKDTGPEPCLGVGLDASSDAAADADAEPQPCLSPPP